jgi:zinc and cadmium transporter
MEKEIFYPFLAFVFLITMVGAWIPTFKVWSKSTFRMIISFCAGTLLGAVFFHILPEISPVLEGEVGYAIMLGFLLIFILEKFIMVHPCEEGECDFHKIGMAAYVGIGFHSILDGVAIGAGSLLNLSTVIILAVTVHKFPAALALSSLLMRGGEYSKKKILRSMFIFALATPLGAVLAILLFQGVDEYLVAMAMGVSAGTFLFISTADLLPAVVEEHEGKEYKNLVSLCLGILVMILSKGLV